MSVLDILNHVLRTLFLSELDHCANVLWQLFNALNANNKKKHFLTDKSQLTSYQIYIQCILHIR